MAEWKRPEVTTIAKYIKGEEVNILKNQKITALFHQHGRVTTGHSGKRMNWKVKKKRHVMNPYADTDILNMPRVNRHEEAELDIRGYTVSESVTKKEKAMNRGKEAIVRFVTDLTKSMLDDIKFHFNGEFYKDGNAAGNLSRIHGFMSWLGETGSAQYTLPSDTYAGLTTGLGDYGGAVVSGTWPSGVFDQEYYFWSPLLVNYTHADWSGSGTWATEALEVLTAGIIHSKNLKGLQGQLDLILMTADMYREFIDATRTKERIQVERRDPSGLISLGFTDVTNWDGVDVSFEADVPDTQAFGLNFKEMELCSWNDQLFVPDDDFEITTLSDQYVIYFFGNLKGNPRATVLWDNYT